MERFVPFPTYCCYVAALLRCFVLRIPTVGRWNLAIPLTTERLSKLTATLEREFRSHNNFAIMHCVALVYDAASFGMTHL